MTQGRRLKSLRLDQGWSAVGLADHLDISPNVIRRAEGTGRRPQARNAFKIATTLGHKVTDLWPLDESEAA